MLRTHISQAIIACAFSVLLAVSGTAFAEAENGAENEPSKPFSRTLRSVSLSDLADRKLDSGIYQGSPKVLANPDSYAKNFYATLASYRGAPIPQHLPPDCDQPQLTEYDAEGCRIVGTLFTDVKDPVKQAELRAQARRGRDVWHKGTFGNQDYYKLYVGKNIHGEVKYPDYSHWLDTRKRNERFSKYGMINDPDCVAGDESTFWMDRCKDPHASGVVGLRKYFNDAPPAGFDPKSTPYQEGELSDSRRFVIGMACSVCHTAFDPTHPPADTNNPRWENLTGHIGNQYTNNTMQFFGNLAPDNYIRLAYDAIEPGQVDTSSGHMDFIYNPGTQNNITDFHNRRVFDEEMKHPISGEIRNARTRRVLKGGEDSVGEKMALLRVYLNIGMCFDECNADIFPDPGAKFGIKSRYQPFRVKQCYQACEPWNQADAKMEDLAAYLITGGPFYLRDAVDVDGKKGSAFIDDSIVPAGRDVFAKECATCHSTKLAPDVVGRDKAALTEFYKGHIFGREDDWKTELGSASADSAEFAAKHLQDGRPKQFAANGVFGQDWLGNDELIAHNIVGTNRCRSMHGNQVRGAVWEEFSSETYKNRPAPGEEHAKVFNPLLPLIGGKESPFGQTEDIDGGRGYYRNVSLLSIWAHAPFLHNNTLGPLNRTDDGGIDTTVAGRIAMFEAAMNQLLMSDDLSVTPHREPKITTFPVDFKIPMAPQGKPFIPVKAGTPAMNVLSINPHSPLFMTCSDAVENKGHQFGVDLSPQEKKALIEFLKTI